MTITVGDLTPRHIGRRVRVTSAHAVIEGQLRGLDVDTDWVTLHRMSVHPDDAPMIPERRTATLTVGEWDTSRVPLGAEVEVLA